MSTAPSALTFEGLAGSVDIDWGEAPRSNPGLQVPQLVVHVNPLDAGAKMPARLLAELPGRLVKAIRTSDIVDQSVGLNTSTDGDAVVVSWAGTTRRGFGTVDPGGPVGVRMNAHGEVALSWTLPSDGMGAIVNEQHLTGVNARSLRAVGAMDLIPPARVVVGVELRDLGMASEDPVTGTARNTAFIGIASSPRTLQVEPDESVSVAAFGTGAGEVAAGAARSLVVRFRQG